MLVDLLDGGNHGHVGLTRRLVALLCVITTLAPSLVLMLPDIASAAPVTWYVTKPADGATNTSTCNAGAQTLSPVTGHLTTIAAAMNCAVNGVGDTINVGNGAWNEHILVNKSGASTSARLTLIARNPLTTPPYAAGSAGAIIRATIASGQANSECSESGYSPDALVRIKRGNNFITIQGFEIDVNSKCLVGVELDTRDEGGGTGPTSPITNVRLQSVHIHHGRGDASVNAGSGLVAWAHRDNQSGLPDAGVHGTANFEVFDSEISFSGASSECLAVDSSNGISRRNIIHDCGDAGIEMTHVGPAGPVTVSDTLIYNARQGGLRTSLAGNYYNIAIVNSGGGQLWTNPSFGSPTGCLAINTPNVGGDASVVGNINFANISCFGNFALTASNSQAPCLLNAGGTSSSAPGTAKNIICFGANAPGGRNNQMWNEPSDVFMPMTVSNSRCDAGGNLAASCDTTANPQYLNTAGNDLHLTGSTPSAITAGGANLSATFTTDKDGLARPASGAWTMGAYVLAVTPVLSVSPASLTAQTTFNGATPAPASISITDTASSGAMAWTASSNVSWASVSPSSGTGNAVITVTYNVTTSGAGGTPLPAAVYTGAITVSAPGASGSPDTTPMTLTINPTTSPSSNRGGRFRR